MASRTYSVVFDNVAVTAAQDFFEITPADDKPVELLGLLLAQSSDTGDAAEEILRYSIVRGHATSGSGGTAPTPRPLDRRGSAAGFTAEVNNTTIASAGTGVTLLHDCFNVRAGLQVWFPPECYPEASQGDTTIVVRLLSTPADSLTMSGTLFLREQG
jgi:hypothetical protein